MDSFQGIQNNPITLNKYLYGNGDPINHIDPSGHLAGLTQEAAAINLLGILTVIAISNSDYFQIGSSYSDDEQLTNKELGILTITGMDPAAGRKLQKLAGSQTDSTVRNRSDTPVDIFRAVEEDEFLDIVECNCFRPSLSLEPKRFWLRRESAFMFGESFLGDPRDWVVVSARISRKMFLSLDHQQMDRHIGETVSVHPPMIPAFNADMRNHGGIRIF